MASGRTDAKALEWAMQVEDENVSDEDRHEVPRRFAKLAAKFQAITQAPGATGGMLGKSGLGGQIAYAAEQWLKKKKPVPGLVLLRIIIKYYATIALAKSCIASTIKQCARSDRVTLKDL